MSGLKIGIDLGGTKTELVMLSPEGKELFRKRVASSQNYLGALDIMTALIQEAEACVGAQASVGVGIPGVVSPYSHVVKNANSTWLNGNPLDTDLAARLGRVVRVANDANCFALSEATDGAAAGYRTVFGVILGTGCGAGLVVDGKVHRGGNAIAGEWGHNPLPWMQPQEFRSHHCFCGKWDCIESFISGPAVVREFNALASTSETRVEAIVELADQGHTLAGEVIERFIDRVSRALGHVVNVLDPDAIVLGGGLSGISSLYDELSLRLPGYSVGGECRTPVLPNLYGAASGVRGAAWLWNDLELPA